MALEMAVAREEENIHSFIPSFHPSSGHVLDVTRDKILLPFHSHRSSFSTCLSNCGAFISHFCCSGTVCHVLASFTIAEASMSP